MCTIDVVYTEVTLGAAEISPYISRIFYQQFGILGIASTEAVFLAILGFAISAQCIHTFHRNVFYFYVVAYGLLTIYHTYWFLGFQ